MREPGVCRTALTPRDAPVRRGKEGKVELAVGDRDEPASHLLASALAPLRATTDPMGLAQAVCHLMTEALAVACRIDLTDELLGGDAAPPGAAMARSVRPQRQDLADPAADCGEPAPRATSLEADLGRDLAWASAPLVARGRHLGVLRVALASASPPSPAVLADVGDIAASVAAALVEAARRREALQLSHSLQRSLLPHSLPDAPWFEVAARYAPATATLQVGGDWYDAQLLGSGELALSVGDVAGHGVEAAARMGELRAAMTALRMVCTGPDELIGLLHRLYDGSALFATAICARLDPSGRFRWSSAGHPHPVVAREGGHVALLEGRLLPPLGVGAGIGLLNERHLRTGDTVVLYTDGLMERRGEPLDVSLGRLTADIASAPSIDPEALVDHVLAARQRSGPTTDDIAVVAARLKSEPEAPPVSRSGGAGAP